MFLGRCPLSVGRKQLLVMLRVKFPQGQWRSVFQCHSVFFPDSNLDLDTGEVGRSLGAGEGAVRIPGTSETDRKMRILPHH